MLIRPESAGQSAQISSPKLKNRGRQAAIQIKLRRIEDMKA
jgi:hypothetical protein